jgi:hypothetical protein
MTPSRWPPGRRCRPGNRCQMKAEAARSSRGVRHLYDHMKSFCCFLVPIEGAKWGSSGRSPGSGSNAVPGTGEISFLELCRCSSENLARFRANPMPAAWSLDLGFDVMCNIAREHCPRDLWGNSSASTHRRQSRSHSIPQKTRSGQNFDRFRPDTSNVSRSESGQLRGIHSLTGRSDGNGKWLSGNWGRGVLELNV